MSELATLARPYARAVFDLAHDKGQLGEWDHALDYAASIAGHEDVEGVLNHPRLGVDELAELFAGDTGLGDHYDHFIRILAENRRLGLLPQIAEQYAALKAEAEKTLAVTVRSQIKLSEDQVSRLASALTAKLGRDVEITQQLDSSVLGGAVIEAGDVVIDASLRGRLAKLQSELAH